MFRSELGPIYGQDRITVRMLRHNLFYPVLKRDLTKNKEHLVNKVVSGFLEKTYKPFLLCKTNYNIKRDTRGVRRLVLKRFSKGPLKHPEMRTI